MSQHSTQFQGIYGGDVSSAEAMSHSAPRSQQGSELRLADSRDVPHDSDAQGPIARNEAQVGREEAGTVAGSEKVEDSHAVAPPLREETDATDERQSFEKQDSSEMTTGPDVFVVEEGNIVDSAGRPYEDVKPSPVPSSRRTSHLHLEFKPGTPQPWDMDLADDEPPRKRLTDPPTALESHKMETFEDRMHTRPLIPKSSYYFGPPSPSAAFGSAPIGQIGVHHPREIIRVERDYTGGELIQFAPIYPLELEGRITPTQFLDSINSINEMLIAAHSLRHSFVDNMLAVFTLQVSRLFWTSHYNKEMKRLRHLFDHLNATLYNPAGLNILWPRDVAFLFLEIEYY